MRALARVVSLPSLDSAIDFSPLTVLPDTSLLDVVALMNEQQATCVLVVNNAGISTVASDGMQVIGWFAQQDVVKLLSCGFDFTTAKISQVMNTSVISREYSEVNDITVALSLLQVNLLPLLAIVDKQGQLVGIVTLKTICQTLQFSAYSEGYENQQLRGESPILEADTEQRLRLLQSSEGLLREVTENIRQVLFVRDIKQNKIIYVTPAYEQIWGRSCSSLYENSLDFLEAIHPLDRDRVITAMSSQVSGQMYSQEYRIVRPDGQVRWVWTRAFPLHNELGEVYRIIGISEDITDSKLTQEALRESEQRFRTVVEQATDAFFLYDFNGKIIDVNQRTCLSLGYSREELLSLSIPDIEQNSFPPEGWELLAAGVPLCLCGVHKRKDGTTFPVEVNLGLLELEEERFILALARDITIRQEAFDTLRQSERRFRAIFNSTFQFTGLLSRSGILLEVNKTTLDFGGLQEKDLGRPFWQARWWTISQATQNQLQEAIALAAKGEFIRYEVDVLGANDTVITIDFSLKPIQDDSGEVVLLIAEGRDISELKQAQAALHRANAELERRVFERTQALQETNRLLLQEIRDRKKAEKALKQSEERFRNLVETSSDWVWEIDENGVYTYASPKIRDILGYEPQEILGKTPCEFMPPKEQERVAKIFAPFAAAQQPFECLENTNIHKDGHLVVLETSGVPIFDAKGKFCGYRGMDRDITERKQAENVLRETQEQLQAILDNSPAVIYAVDAENRFLLINHQYEKLFHITKAQIVGKSVYDTFPREIADGFAINNKQVLATGIPVKVEEVAPQDDGLHTYLSVKFALKNANGFPYAVCGISTDITDRKRVEDSLVRFRKAIESTCDAIGIADFTGEAMYVNPAFIELFEYSLEELQAAGGPPAIYTDKAEAATILAAVQSGKSWRGEVKMQTYTGRILDIDLRANAIKDATGKIIGLMGVHTDITDRKRSEESLRLRDRAIAASSNGIVISDARLPNTPIIYANSAFERITGYSPEEVIGRNFRFLQGVDSNQSEIKELQAAIKQLKSCTVILRNYCKNGSLFWNELTISPVFDADGNCTHYVGIQNDITERKQAEMALLVSQERLQYLLFSSPAVIYTRKPSGDYGATFISDNIIAMMGYQAREFLEDSSFWMNHIHPEDLAGVVAEVSNILEQGEHSCEYRFLHKNGTYRWVYEQAKLVRDDAGNPLEIVGYWADITKRKQLEEELRTALAKEKELSELKSRFVTMTSHEFRTPLSTILSSSELLEHYRHKWNEEKQITHLHRIQAAVKHMTNLLNDVLVIGKAEVGKLEFKPVPLDLLEYCRYLVEELQMDVGYQQHAIAFNCEYEFIPCCMDDKLVGHILRNLLSNAIKYSPDGSTVEFTLTCHQEQAVFEIQDKGIGIPKEDLPRLFESFHRATNVGNIQGTGLGLAIVKKCVDLHKGEITVISEVGAGTTFTVSLPLKNV